MRMWDERSIVFTCTTFSLKLPSTKMNEIQYIDNQLFLESIPVSYIAQKYGTPCYAYSKQHIQSQWRAFDQAFKNQSHLICYAVKANSNLAILNLLAQLGSGFDIVSGGELTRVLKAGGDPQKIVFSGVGKQEWEIRLALETGIFSFNVESESELLRIEKLADKCRIKAPISIRVNPNVDAETHPYISTGLKDNKFGVDETIALKLYQIAAHSPNLVIKGIDCHIGSQLTQLAPLKDAFERVRDLIMKLRTKGIQIHHIDIGGGIGIRYDQETPFSLQAYATLVEEIFVGLDAAILVEPGRAIIGNAGILITRIEILKKTLDRNFAIVDAAMNDLIRPALYQGWHKIDPVIQPSETTQEIYDIVGPICETADFLAKNRSLPPLKEGDLLAIRSTGAYGFVMSSNYNSRPRAPEILVNQDNVFLIREREKLEDLYRGEKIPSETL